VKHALVDRDARILDVGCGAGRLLLRMTLGGFKHCVGVDPFIDGTIRYDNGVVIHKQELAAMAAEGRDPFDLIMFHHSFEHMAEPIDVLRDAASLLSPGGVILIRIPAIDSDTADRYGEHWIGLDAPRHLFLPTADSMDRCAQRVGLKVVRRESKASRAQIVTSELFSRDIPANAAKQEKDIFTRADLAEFDQRVAEADRNNRGAEATYYLRRAEHT